MIGVAHRRPTQGWFLRYDAAGLPRWWWYRAVRQVLGQGGRFALVGVLATAVHYATIVLLVDGLHSMGPTPATVIGSMLGIATAYLGNYLYVFRVRDGRHATYASRFAMVYLAVMALHAGLMHLMADRLGLAYTIGFVAATICSAITTFLGNRCLVFTGGLAAREVRAD